MNDLPRIVTARVEWIGDEQVIHLPKGYCLATNEVRVTFEEDGIVVEEIADELSEWSNEELQRLALEGLDSGPDEPWDGEDIKRAGRERLMAARASR